MINLKYEATTLASYLKKETDLNGKKHVKATALDDAQLGALISWLLQQKK